MICLNIGEAVKLARTRKKISRAELAQKSGVTSREIAMIEKGERVFPKLDTLQKIARGLGVKTCKLIAMTEDVIF